ncbi:hypothetical protein [Chlorobium sp. KB01]|uniref:hypothetical protein n=1 Tax=Chlorobium sp. KB01 TaxID=1917528 RepID=UPI000977E018|nr:hypothetical protein [Chlorobium sp. KB01]
MKKGWKILTGIAAVIVLLLAVVMFATSGMRSTADDFFGSVKQQDMTKARTYLSEEFKASTNEEALKEFLSRSALLNFKEAKWAESSINGGRGELNGTITTETGGNIPIKLMFIKENDEWKIYAMQKPTAGLQPSESSEASAGTTPKKSATTVPGKAEQIALARQSMHDFALSIKSKNMGHFRTTISNMWQSQFTTEKLNEGYAPIIKADIDLTVLDPLVPILDQEASINQDGVLIIKGHYPTKPSVVSFESKYIYEGISWKLIGFFLDIK